MRDRSCELQAQESLFNKTTLFHDNKTWPQIKYLGAQWTGLSEGKYSRGWKLRSAVEAHLDTVSGPDRNSSAEQEQEQS